MLASLSRQTSIVRGGCETPAIGFGWSSLHRILLRSPLVARPRSIALFAPNPQDGPALFLILLPAGASPTNPVPTVPAQDGIHCARQATRASLCRPATVGFPQGQRETVRNNDQSITHIPNSWAWISPPLAMMNRGKPTTAFFSATSVWFTKA